MWHYVLLNEGDIRTQLVLYAYIAIVFRTMCMRWHTVLLLSPLVVTSSVLRYP